MRNEWVYSATIISIIGGLVGLVIGYLALRKLSRAAAHDPKAPRPVLSWLLVGIAMMSFAMASEQSRVLAFRLSYDGLLDRSYFDWLYNNEFVVAITKVLGVAAILGMAALQKALILGLPDKTAVFLGGLAGAATFVLWVILAKFLILSF